ncbi:ankyrin repeat domain-containing protein [Legionella spiritensis]|uniref:Ankyrin repeats (3 copies) n=1 Tax=Legionella spiritensis TaxID=452 RepID=A0A0W0YWX0_LEGSP|nr:hypothetical protein [Legionella spiritensis]KTD60998.1 Ankyrin repeats (3 copies) [Legionella spiritensis]SNV32137.1 Ankyrin repeats (3 copies) [Legionella spiritensis]
MGFFDSVVEAAQTNDIWTLERLYREEYSSGNFDQYTRHLALTPAGHLAREGQWEAVALLFDHYRVTTDGILFGAVLGGHYDDIRILLQNPEPDDTSILARVCARHIEKSNRKKRNYWNPIIKALAIQDQTEAIDEILKQFSFSEQCEEGLLQAAVEGAAFAGNDTRVFALFKTIEDNLKSFDETIKLSNSIQSLEKAALKAAAQGGHKKLVNDLRKRNIEKYKARTSPCTETDVNREKSSLLQTAIEGALCDGHLDLVKTLFKKRLKIEKTLKKPKSNDLFFSLASSTIEKLFIASVNCLIESAFQQDQYPLIEEYVSDELISGRDYWVKASIRSTIRKQNKNKEPWWNRHEPNIIDLRQRYQLIPRHASLLQHDIALVEQIASNAVTVTEDIKDRLQKLLQTPCVEMVISWIKEHKPRAEFLDSLKNYMDEYEKSWVYGRNHYERATSVLSVITYKTDDETFRQLIEQQAALLKREEHDIVIGSKEDKHNQPVVHRLQDDKFTKAVKQCLAALATVPDHSSTETMDKEPEAAEMTFGL